MVYQIPLFHLNFDEKEIKAATETIRSGWISTGPKCAFLEQMFVDSLGVDYAVSVSNCTAALHLCCLVCGIGPGDEVICPSLTFAASVNCIKYVGATPVFCDIVSSEHINIDPREIEKQITSKTKAIVVVHMAGFSAKMDEIMQIAQKYGLKVIEDACHGPLSEYRGKKLGTIGDCAAFSFFSNKNISAGEGGMFVTNHQEMAEKAKLLRSHGMTTLSYQRADGHATAYDVIELGYNFRLDDIHAAIAIEQLKKLPTDLKKRAIIRKWYLEKLSNVEGIVIPFQEHTDLSSNYIMPIVLKNSTSQKRDSIRNAIHAAGIQTSVHYPPVHKFSIYQKYGAKLPQTEYVSNNEITLPMYASLSLEQVEFICSVVNGSLHE